MNFDYCSAKSKFFIQSQNPTSSALLESLPLYDEFQLQNIPSPRIRIKLPKKKYCWSYLIHNKLINLSEYTATTGISEQKALYGIVYHLIQKGIREEKIKEIIYKFADENSYFQKSDFEKNDELIKKIIRNCTIFKDKKIEKKELHILDIKSLNFKYPNGKDEIKVYLAIIDYYCSMQEDDDAFTFDKIKSGFKNWKFRKIIQSLFKQGFLGKKKYLKHGIYTLKVFFKKLKDIVFDFDIPSDEFLKYQEEEFQKKQNRNEAFLQSLSLSLFPKRD